MDGLPVKPAAVAFEQACVGSTLAGESDGLVWSRESRTMRCSGPC